MRQSSYVDCSRSNTYKRIRIPTYEPLSPGVAISAMTPYAIEYVPECLSAVEL